MSATAGKRRGAYFTPQDAVAALVRWAVRKPSDRMLDPSCGDGRFMALHENSVPASTGAARLVPNRELDAGGEAAWRHRPRRHRLRHGRERLLSPATIDRTKTRNPVCVSPPCRSQRQDAERSGRHSGTSARLAGRRRACLVAAVGRRRTTPNGS